ncbi:glycosyltransferase family 2 protein [Sphaerisporangium perillae]|uniref:glycosyltransferase family 2 protein n=1 Tax=Sphaerisporangium perillae TaxID=2935860 RepID=UPI0020100CDC|nr:glycosyltransferase family 2 protein [Sphaerisporangium perillae]
MKITVLTPTYNRAHSLPRLYESLTRQNADFEWVVVDDGSTDGTQDLVTELSRQAPFPLSYLRQEANAGKHVAVNRGMRAATGELVGVVDSDDWLLQDALATVCGAWTEIPAESRDRFCGVAGRCVTEHGVVGPPFADGLPHLEGTYYDLLFRHRRHEEYLRFDRLDLLRLHPFPESPSPRFIPESMVWRKVGRDHLLRYLDHPIRFYHLDGADRLSDRPFGELAAGRRIFYKVTLNEDLDYWPQARDRFMKWSAQYVRSSLHMGITPGRQLRDLDNARARLLTIAALPVGFALFLADRRRRARHAFRAPARSQRALSDGAAAGRAAR